MPTRTEIVIQIGEVLDCLPPGKAFKRRRYNSFDANSVGNEENLAPEVSGVPVMKPVKLEAEDDDEVSFRQTACNGDSGEASGPKPKRKTSAEKFLEDNVNYFQLEVLSSKTRSNKRISDKGETSEDDEESKEGFHNSFLDFLKSKGVEKEQGGGRSRHKSAGSEQGREGRSRTLAGRSRSSHSPYQRSRSSNRQTNGRSKSRGRSKSQAKPEESASESESEAKAHRPRRGTKPRAASPSGSEADSVSSRPTSRRSRRGRAAESEGGSSDEESRSRASSPLSKPSPRKKRSELDKLLEAVDTSFHFETAAAERKRLSDSGLGPLEIDCSDTGSEASGSIASKRKNSELANNGDGNVVVKKQKVSNNLLKTASPGSAVKGEAASGSESEVEGSTVAGSTAWDGWELLGDQLQSITNSPVEIDQLHFSFETEPVYESWYSTYQRQDRGDELVFYPASTSAPFQLPYEMNYNLFMPGKAAAAGRREETPLSSAQASKAASPVRQSGPSSGRKGRSRKVSECESTDSSEDLRRGRGRPGRPGKAAPLLPAHLQEPNYRVSPRQHASTKSFLTGSEADGGVGELDDLAEAYIMRDEAELHFSNLDALAEDSNDSYGSAEARPRRPPASVSESHHRMAGWRQLVQAELTAGRDAVDTVAAKVPPTRSRVSSEQLLSPKKSKEKKKRKAQAEDVSPMDQQVEDMVDPVLLDLLEDEMPTVPLEELVPEPLELVDTFPSCTSMALANKRWLKPSKLDVLASQAPTPSPIKPKRRFLYKDDLPGFSMDSDMEQEKMPVSKRKPKEEPKEEKKPKKPVKEEEEESEEEEKPKPKKRGPSPSKKTADPSKPKRIIIYKDDLPGFEVLPDSDVESEKLPVSKRGGKPGPKPGKKKVKSAKVVEVEEDEEEDDDDDSVSVDSSSSTSSGPKKKRKMNRTGFPSPKKKKPTIKKEINNLSPKVKLDKISVKNSLKSPKSSLKTSPPSASKNTKTDAEVTKKKVPKQVKLDRFITKTPKNKESQGEGKSPVSGDDASNSRRSATLNKKNYSELESDTESMLEGSVGSAKAGVKKTKACPTAGSKAAKKK